MSEYNYNFDSEYMLKIEEQLRETQEEFAYAMISPFCETVTEKKLSKKELKDILRKGMQPSIPLDKVKQVREEIANLDTYYDNDLYTDNYDSMFKCSEVLEILDKLIESEESKCTHLKQYY